MGIKQVIEGGYCIGCGVCAAATSNKISIAFDEFGQYQAIIPSNLDEAEAQKASAVCPFSDAAENEDQIGSRLFGNTTRDDRIGSYHSLFAGHVAEGNYRSEATSGGVITWLTVQMLRSNTVDGVIHVRKSMPSSTLCLFEYSISRDANSVLAGAKSRYYPIESSLILQQVKQNPGKYAFVGVPCFVKAVRNLMKQDPIFHERIRYCIGIVCGHLKSKAFAECFGWQAGIPPGKLEDIDFRVKREEGLASDYAVCLKGNEKEITRQTRSFLGANWGHNFFRYSACDYCDDVFAETADIAVGDAWLPKYDQDPKGNSVVVIRDKALDILFRSAIVDGRLQMSQVSADTVAVSQGGGLRDRREGLAYRLFLKELRNEWAPRKRIRPSNSHLGVQRKKIYRHRSEMAAMSHKFWAEAVAKDDLSRFETKMRNMIEKNPQSYRPIAVRLYRKLKNIIGK